MAADKAALILFRALPEFKASAPWIQDLAEAAFIRGMEEGKRQCGPNLRPDDVIVPADVYDWLMGRGEGFQPHDKHGDPKAAYWWRSELRQRIAAEMTKRHPATGDRQP